METKCFSILVNQTGYQHDHPLIFNRFYSQRDKLALFYNFLKKNKKQLSFKLPVEFHLSGGTSHVWSMFNKGKNMPVLCVYIMGFTNISDG